MKTIAIVACVLGFAACDDDTTSAGNGDLSMMAGADMTVPDMAVRRMADVPLTFQPEGLWWDSASQALYIANDKGPQIIKWDETNSSASFVVFAKLPDINPKSGSLGQVIKIKDGSWLTTRFGFGMAGAVLQTTADGQHSMEVAGLATARERIGLTEDANGNVYTGWFTGSMPVMNGTVSKVALDGSGETNLVTGIGKPVGVLALGDQLYISDQMNGVVVKTPLASPGTTTTFATLPSPDELAAGPNGTLFAVSHAGSVWSIATDGTPTMIKDGYKPLRGVAYDGDHKRLIVSEPDSGTPDGGAGMPMLHVLPID